MGRVLGNLALSRSIGDFEYKTSEELSWKEQAVTALPDVRYFDLSKYNAEYVIVCCDGIWDMKTNEECAAFVRNAFSEKDSSEKNSTVISKLFSDCLKEKTDGSGTKGTDNMTAIIVKIKETKDSTP